MFVELEPTVYKNNLSSTPYQGYALTLQNNLLYKITLSLREKNCKMTFKIPAYMFSFIGNNDAKIYPIVTVFPWNGWFTDKQKIKDNCVNQF